MTTRHQRMRNPHNPHKCRDPQNFVLYSFYKTLNKPQTLHSTTTFPSSHQTIRNHPSLPHLSHDDDDKEVFTANSQPKNTTFTKQNKFRESRHNAHLATAAIALRERVSARLRETTREHKKQQGGWGEGNLGVACSGGTRAGRVFFFAAYRTQSA